MGVRDNPESRDPLPDSLGLEGVSQTPRVGSGTGGGTGILTPPFGDLGGSKLGSGLANPGQSGEPRTGQAPGMTGLGQQQDWEFLPRPGNQRQYASNLSILGHHLTTVRDGHSVKELIRFNNKY